MIKPRIAGRISFHEIAEAHRRLESGGLDGKLVLCPAIERIVEVPRTFVPYLRPMP